MLVFDRINWISSFFVFSYFRVLPANTVETRIEKNLFLSFNSRKWRRSRGHHHFPGESRAQTCWLGEVSPHPLHFQSIDLWCPPAHFGSFVKNGLNPHSQPSSPSKQICHCALGAEQLESDESANGTLLFHHSWCNVIKILCLNFAFSKDSQVAQRWGGGVPTNSTWKQWRLSWVDSPRPGRRTLDLALTRRANKTRSSEDTERLWSAEGTAASFASLSFTWEHL